jgi:hypothetical protein
LAAKLADDQFMSAIVTCPHSAALAIVGKIDSAKGTASPRHAILALLRPASIPRRNVVAISSCMVLFLFLKGLAVRQTYKNTERKMHGRSEHSDNVPIRMSDLLSGL